MRKLIAPAIGAIATVVLVAAPAAEARSKWADVRVVTNTGDTLADHRQYTENVAVDASRKADCFGETNPSSNKDYKLRDPNVLGALIDASESDDDLMPLLITDAFVDDGFGFGVCDIGGVETSGFSYWYSSANGVGATTGPDLIPVQNGDENLWYLTTGNEAGFPSELSIDAPTAVLTNDPYTVTVTRTLPDGMTEPAEGVSVGGETTGPDGTAELTAKEGTNRLVATGGPDDVFSKTVKVCAAATLASCPASFGIRIYGSDQDDRIRSTFGDDVIKCGRGDDLVTNSQRGDRIAENCERVKRSRR